MPQTGASRCMERQGRKGRHRPLCFALHLLTCSTMRFPKNGAGSIRPYPRYAAPCLAAVDEAPMNMPRWPKGRWPAGNAAIGTTVEDQPRANINVPALLQASVDLWHAKTRPLFLFLSCEPLIGPVDLTAFKEYPESKYNTDALRGKVWMRPEDNDIPSTRFVQKGRDYIGLCHNIQWVIVGGETDQGEHKARPAHPNWVRSLRDQCADAGVAFHFKQWGEYVPQLGSVTLDDSPEISRFDWMEWTGKEWEHWHKPCGATSWTRTTA
ncbi:DUF5131 family protein [Agrobacterium tumefaciens]|nr:DUF5131 family protein [Agrobacterium tumefaciens]